MASICKHIVATTESNRLRDLAEHGLELKYNAIHPPPCAHAFMPSNSCHRLYTFAS